MKEVMAKTVQYAAKEVLGCTRGAVLFCNTWTRKTGIYPGKCFDKYCMFWKHKQNPLNCLLWTKILVSLVNIMLNLHVDMLHWV